jgi:hypothetical protein
MHFAPVDADFYYGAYQLKNQWDRFLKGPVVQELTELPGFSNAMETFKAQWAERDGLGGQARTYLGNENAKDALAFLEDLISTDVFAVGDSHCALWYEVASKLNEDLQMVVQNASSLDEEARNEQLAIIATRMIEGLDKLVVPTLLSGGKCNDEDRALTKIDQLETGLFALGFNEEAAKLLKNLKRVEDSRGNRLVWTYSGKQVPWDSIPTNDVFDEEMKDSLQKVAEKKAFCITIGLLDGFFVVGVGPTPEAIESLGKGKTVLENADMEPVRNAMSKSLTSVSFVSDALSKANFNSSLKNFFSRNVAANLMQAAQQLDEASELRDFTKDVVTDCKWVDESIGKLVPEFKGSTSVGYLTETGWEQHFYYRTKDVVTDSTQPLLALEHVGGDPMLLVTLRFQKHPEYFQLVREIAKRFKTRLDAAAELDWSELDIDNGSEETVENINLAWPFLARLADTWEKKFLPSMSGEHTIVMSAGNLSSKQWVKDMPPSEDELPLPEFAAVTGVTDTSLFKSGFEDLFAILDDVVVAVRNKHPESIPEAYKIPRPVQSNIAAGEKFGYPIPEDCPVPPEMMPQGLFSGTNVVFSYSDKQAIALAQVKKLALGSDYIDPQAKQSSASYVHLGRVIEFARPWVRYGLTESMASLDDSLLDESAAESIGEYQLTGKDLLGLWTVLGKIGEFSSTATLTPQGVTHVRSEYRSQK